MGLTTTHDCYDGTYTGFNDMRNAISESSGYGDYREMCETQEFPSEDVLRVLFSHSDCDGELEWEICEKLADRLSEVHKLIGNTYQANITNRFIHGLRVAFAKQENVEFR